MTPPATPTRVQLALNVTDLDEAVRFYAQLFGVTPHKQRPGYANFAVEEPPLKLVLIEGGPGGSLNHLGVEVATTTEVEEATARLAAAGLATDVESATTCCHAVQDKVWVTGPDRERWEVYTVLDDSPASSTAGPVECCTPESCCAESGCCA